MKSCNVRTADVVPSPTTPSSSDSGPFLACAPPKARCRCNAVVCKIVRNAPIMESRKEDIQQRTRISLARRPSGESGHAVALEEELDQLERRPPLPADCAAYAVILRRCGNAKSLSAAKRVQALVTRDGRCPETFLLNLLVQMYGKCGSLEDASAVFRMIPEPNVFSWNIMLAAYAQNGYLREARIVFEKAAKKNVVSWNAMVAAYAQNGHSRDALQLLRTMCLEGVQLDRVSFIGILQASMTLRDAKFIHSMAFESGYQSEITVGTALVNTYCKCRSLEDAKEVFDSMRQRNVVSWTAMLAGYAQNGHLQDARRMFDQMPDRNVVSWNAMIAAYVEKGHCNQAIQLFREMDVQPDKITLISVLAACRCLEEGKAVHAKIRDCGLELDTAVANAVIGMYGRCRSMEDASCIFHQMPRKNVISWTAMIAAFAQNGHPLEALKLFQNMDLEGVQADEITFLAILEACTTLAAAAAAAARAEVRSICASIAESSFRFGIVLENALIDMYAKCGSPERARDVFRRMQQRNVVSWTALVGAYAQNGHGAEALEIVRSMDVEGVPPDSITFMSILSACSHAGLLEDARHYFFSMSQDYGIQPCAEHYWCIIDLLGRSGQVGAAEELITSMPFEPDASAWTALLAACQTLGDAKRGAWTANQVFHLEAEDASPYVLLSNIHSTTGESSWRLKDMGVQPKD